MSVRAFIGIGCNLGDRSAHCRAAVDRLGRLPGAMLLRVSPTFESVPQEGVQGGPFLNAVAKIATSLSPRQLLAHLQQIEVALGRPANHFPGAARTMDLDLLLYGEVVIREADLTIPHPRMAERRFVLEPLVALAPSLSHPVLQVTVTELLRRLTPETSQLSEGVPR